MAVCPHFLRLLTKIRGERLAYNTYWHGVPLTDDGTLARLRQKLRTRKQATDRSSFRHFQMRAHGSAKKAMRLAQRDELPEAIYHAYIASVYLWAAVFPANGDSVREWLPIFKRIRKLTVPPRYRAVLSQALGRPRTDKELRHRKAMLDAMIRWSDCRLSRLGRRIK